MSLSWVPWNQPVEDPSKQTPPSKLSKSRALGGTDKCRHRPGRSVYRRDNLNLVILDRAQDILGRRVIVSHPDSGVCERRFKAGFRTRERSGWLISRAEAQCGVLVSKRQALRRRRHLQSQSHCLSHPGVLIVPQHDGALRSRCQGGSRYSRGNTPMAVEY